MLPVVAVTLLLVAATVLTWALARGWWTMAMWPHMRPVARLFTFALLANAARFGLQRLVLAGEPKPYVGLARAVYHVEQALVLAWPAAIAGVALLLFVPPAPAPVAGARRRRGPWAIAAAWAVCLVAVAVAYPWLRQERLGVAYAAWSWACCAVVVALAIWSYRRVLFGTHHITVMMLTLAEGAAASAYLNIEAARRWDAPLSAYGTALAMLVVYYLVEVLRYRRRR